MKVSFPPNHLLLPLTDWATSPLMPKEQMLTKWRAPFSPEAAANSTAPTSKGFAAPAESRANASSSDRPRPNVRRRSPPVPNGTIPSDASGLIGCPASKKPFTTSLMVPSPPTATMQE